MSSYLSPLHAPVCVRSCTPDTSLLFITPSYSITPSQTWVEQVNKAEAEFWRRSGGVRVGWSDEILGFDCGGQQWVLEVSETFLRLF